MLPLVDNGHNLLVELGMLLAVAHMDTLAGEKQENILIPGDFGTAVRQDIHYSCCRRRTWLLLLA